MHGNVFLRELRGNDQHESREAVRWHGAHSLVGSFRCHRRRGCSVGRRSFGRRDGGRVSGRPGWCAIKVLLSPSQPVTTSRFLPTSSLLKANGPAFSWL